MSRCLGRLTPNSRGFAFVEPEGGGLSVFVPPRLFGLFLLDDTVEVETQTDERGRLTATSIRLVHRPRTRLLGRVDDRRSLATDRSLATRDVRLIGSAKPGSFVVARLLDDQAEVLRELDPRDVPLEVLLERYGIEREVSKSVLGAASAARLRADPTRRDLRHLPTITIDAPVSRDLDDALSVYPAEPDGSLRLLVSIADVDALVPEGSVLDQDARRRATSVYLAGLVLNMLPPALSEDALSLVPGKDRPALTVELRIDPEGTVTSVDVWKTLIRSAARLDYDGVTRFLDEGDPRGVPEAVQPTVRWLRTAAARIDQKRRARGGVTLASEEATIHVDEQTREPVSIEARRSTSAHLLVERLMVACNEAVASWLLDRGLPGVFRVHPAPTPERVEKLETFAKNLGFYGGFGGLLTPSSVAAFRGQAEGQAVCAAMDTMIGRTLGTASYTAEVGMHFGLGAPRYLHFTSPIRRYADLAVHRVIKRFLEGTRGGEAPLGELAAHIDQRSRAAAKAEAERTRMMAARLFKTRLGERFRGTVISVRPFGVVVQLEGAGVAGTIALDELPGGRFELDQANEVVMFGARRLTIGMSVVVRVRDAREAEGRIDLELDEPGGAASPTPPAKRPKEAPRADPPKKGVGEPGRGRRASPR